MIAKAGASLDFPRSSEWTRKMLREIGCVWGGGAAAVVNGGSDEYPCCVEGWVQTHILSCTACIAVDNLTYLLQMYND